ncbi:hypothetical protein [Flammeovirga pacifica]|uniref:Outer membrane protein beta-barrel domain-containing protein n=1 Tax=Flammeovirga pacifica TaxID=915059 RepID=A0A1S1Z3Z5_FLAPC|nr:hypothetical protein [Flammeovirga pacifica]OHX67947.1 hypothetical protein NH26_17170 [Flammeovirga pacifica]
MKKILFLFSFLFFSTLSMAQIHFGIGGGGSQGVGDLSPFSSTGFSAYIEFGYNAGDKWDGILSGQVNGFAAIPIDPSLTHAWYQVPIIASGRYYFLGKEGTLFHPYVQGGFGGVKSYFLQARGTGQDPKLIDDFWSFGLRGGVGATIAIFNLQMNYLYSGNYQGYTLGALDFTIGFYF